MLTSFFWGIAKETECRRICFIVFDSGLRSADYGQVRLDDLTFRLGVTFGQEQFHIDLLLCLFHLLMLFGLSGVTTKGHLSPSQQLLCIFLMSFNYTHRRFKV